MLKRDLLIVQPLLDHLLFEVIDMLLDLAALERVRLGFIEFGESVLAVFDPLVGPIWVQAVLVDPNLLVGLLPQVGKLFH